MVPSRSGRRIALKRWIWAGGLLLLVALFVAFFVREAQREGFSLARFSATFANLHWGWMAASGALALATYWGRALRWAVLVRPVRPDAPIWPLTVATTIGFTAIVILGRPGELVRPYLIGHKLKVPFSSQLGALFLERIFDLLAALLVFGFGLSQIAGSGVQVGPALGWVLEWGGKVVVLLCALCLAVLGAIRQFAEPMRRRLIDGLGILPEAHRPRAEALANALVKGVEATRHGPSLVLLLAYTLLEWVLIIGVFYCLVQSYRGVLNLSFTDVVIFMGFVAFGGVVQLPGVGGGSQMVSILILRELFGAPLEVATSMAFVLWIVTFVIIVPFGLGFALHEGISLAKLKAIGQEAQS